VLEKVWLEKEICNFYKIPLFYQSLKPAGRQAMRLKLKNMCSADSSK
jgi:hypothetical protein